MRWFFLGDFQFWTNSLVQTNPQIDLHSPCPCSLPTTDIGLLRQPIVVRSCQLGNPHTFHLFFLHRLTNPDMLDCRTAGVHCPSERSLSGTTDSGLYCCFLFLLHALPIFLRQQLHYSCFLSETITWLKMMTFNRRKYIYMVNIIGYFFLFLPP